MSRSPIQALADMDANDTPTDHAPAAAVVIDRVSEDDNHLRAMSIDVTQSVALATHELLYRARCEATGETVAFIVGRPHEYIHMLYVLEEWRARGFGRACVQTFDPSFVYNVLPETENFWTECGFAPSTECENEWTRG